MNKAGFSVIELLILLVFMEIIIVLAKKVAHDKRIKIVAVFPVLSGIVIAAWGGMVLVARLAGGAYTWSDAYNLGTVLGALGVAALLTLAVWFSRRERGTRSV
jgi:hypothetical protein